MTLQDRQTIKQMYYEGKSFREIGKAIGYSHTAVWGSNNLAHFFMLRLDEIRPDLIRLKRQKFLLCCNS